ncbi:LexA family transcriptional regulator [Ensifer sp. SL37]|uniref:LexA family transcriptional regulator n=1 Tax=Ensifer sp. SL37 TaxID=2995137 RepID=UPI00227590B0|nr:LexA family transcriptional regulator [Ensifer sp. SL37]MCY1741187.1 LexA family transcriptional regulator [Ensifer sp. SL37]
MSLIDKKRLAKAMEAAGIKPAPLASLIGRDKDYIRDYLKGRKESLKADDAQKIASALNVPLTELTEGEDSGFAPVGMEVVGKVAAGRYRDISVEDQETKKPRIAFARDMRFPHARQYALEVDGDSMNELFPNGSYVVCVNLIESGLELKNGMSVHVERSIMGGQLVETTLKEVHREGKNRLVLKPRSTNPSHEPIYIDGSESDEIAVRGVVIGKWEPVIFGV